MSVGAGIGSVQARLQANGCRPRRGPLQPSQEPGNGHHGCSPCVARRLWSIHQAPVVNRPKANPGAFS
jgi:hypothetical protein